MTYTKDQFEQASKIHDKYIEETIALSVIAPTKTITQRTVSKKEYDKAKDILTTYVRNNLTSKYPQTKLF